MRISLLSFVTAVITATATSGHAQQPNPLPEGNGRDLVGIVCTQCHALTTIAKIRLGAPGWRLYVDNMVLRGAQLTAPEINTVVDYLSLNLGPGAQLPPAKPVALPGGSGKELVETRCNLCHDLERVATIKRNKGDWPAIVTNMVSRGATATPEEAQAITAYLVGHFGE
jgi:cytochrome c5